MIKIYARRAEEIALIELLHGEGKRRLFVTYPIKGRTRKVRGKNLYKVINSQA